MGHENKCAHLHGHNYTILVTVELKNADGSDLDPLGRTLDFAEVKARVGEWLEREWDHGFILHADDQHFRRLLAGCKIRDEPYTSQKLYVMPYNPTAENMARYLLREICPILFADTNCRVTAVRVHETVNCSADARIIE